MYNNNSDENDIVDSFTDGQVEVDSRLLVLRKSSQCLAVFHFDATRLDKVNSSCAAQKILRLFEEELQSLCSTFFTEECQEVPPTDDTFVCVRLGKITYTMSTSRKPRDVLAEKLCHVVSTPKEGSECHICMSTFEISAEADQVVCLNSCKHCFHLQCFQQAISHKEQCPVCRSPFSSQTPTGNQPSGTMTTKVINDDCEGCAGNGSLQIMYSFRGGYQASFHPSPGIQYHGTSRTAYVPNTSDGRRLVARLQEAFRHGLIFTVGTSLTTQTPNSITWASIPHKTQLRGGVRAHGFPDDLYFENCNNALDALHVRQATSDELFSECA